MLTSNEIISYSFESYILQSIYLISYSSRSVRMQWGHLVRTGVVKRDFRLISINNIITLGTRIRIVILKVYCQPNVLTHLQLYTVYSKSTDLVVTTIINEPVIRLTHYTF